MPTLRFIQNTTHDLDEKNQMNILLNAAYYDDCLHNNHQRREFWEQDLPAHHQQHDPAPLPHQQQQPSSAFASVPSPTTARLLAGSSLRAHHFLPTFGRQQEELLLQERSSTSTDTSNSLLFSPSSTSPALLPLDPSSTTSSASCVAHAHDRSKYYYRLAASLNKVYDATVSCRAELLLNEQDENTSSTNKMMMAYYYPPVVESPKERGMEPTKNNTILVQQEEPSHTKNNAKRSSKKFQDRLEELLAHKRTHGTLYDISTTGQTLPLYKWCSDVRIAFSKKLRNEPDRRLRRFTDKHFRALFEIGFDYRIPDCDDYFPAESVMKRKKSQKNGRNIEDDIKNLAEYDFLSIASGDSSFHLLTLHENDMIPESVPSSRLNVQQSIETHHPLSTNIPPSRVVATKTSPKKTKAKCTTTTSTSYLKFNQRICDLEAYRIEHGTLFNLTKRYNGYRSLGAWVAEVRLAYKKKINGLRSRSKISDDQFRQLYEIGFDFKENCTKCFGLESDLKREKAIAEAKLRYEERKRKSKETSTEVTTQKEMK
jgi:hypothetical protein